MHGNHFRSEPQTCQSTLFHDGLERTETTAAYYGLGVSQLKQLITRGEIEASKLEIGFSLKVTTDNEKAAKLPRERNLFPRDKQIAKAHTIASRCARFDLIRSRMTEEPSVFGLTMLWQLAHQSSVSDLGRRSTFLIPLKLIFDSFRTFGVKRDGTFHDQVLNFASEIGWSKGAINSEGVQKLGEAFKGLPDDGGYVIGLNPTVLQTNKPITNQKVKKIYLVDVTGIEPLGDDEYQLLEKFLQTP